MVIETMNYHTNHIKSIRMNKEYLKIKHNVGIDITIRRFGEYQEVDIKGSPKNIRTCKESLKCVIDQADFEYKEYLERKSRRTENRPSKQFKLPDKIITKKRSNTNPFSALEGLDDEDNNDYASETLYDKSFPSISTYNPNVSWGDMSDDEE